MLFILSLLHRELCKYTTLQASWAALTRTNQFWSQKVSLAALSDKLKHAPCCHQHVPCRRVETAGGFLKTVTLAHCPGSSIPSHQLSCFLPENSLLFVLPSFVSFDLLNALHFLLQSRFHLLENFEKLLFRDRQIGCKVSEVLFP